MTALESMKLIEGDVLYRKINGRYTRCNDPCAYQGLREGTWLVKVTPGYTSIRVRVQEYSPEFQAVMQTTVDELMRLITEVSLPRDPEKLPISPKLREDWENLVKNHGPELSYFSYRSIHDMAEKIVEKIITNKGK